MFFGMGASFRLSSLGSSFGGGAGSHCCEESLGEGAQRMNLDHLFCPGLRFCRGLRFADALQDAAAFGALGGQEVVFLVLVLADHSVGNLKCFWALRDGAVLLDGRVVADECFPAVLVVLLLFPNDVSLRAVCFRFRR